MACEKCAEFGGGWKRMPTGMARCDCLDPLPDLRAKVPALTVEAATVFTEMLGAIPFFPAKEDKWVRMAITDDLRTLCAGPVEAEWLVRRMRRLYGKWPGTLEMRRVYASKFPPHDGEMPLAISEYYPDGIPSERQQVPQIAAPALRLLPDGRKEEVIEDPAIHAAIAKAAAKLPKMPKAIPLNGRSTEALHEAITAPQDRPELPAPTPQVLTQADIAAAVQKLHEERALIAEGASD